MTQKDTKVQFLENKNHVSILLDSCEKSIDYDNFDEQKDLLINDDNNQ